MPRIQQYSRKLERHSRHVPKIIKYGTLKKITNILVAEFGITKALKSKTPFVEWQFIVFKHNEH